MSDDDIAVQIAVMAHQVENLTKKIDLWPDQLELSQRHVLQLVEGFKTEAQNAALDLRTSVSKVDVKADAAHRRLDEFKELLAEVRGSAKTLRWIASFLGVGTFAGLIAMARLIAGS